MRFGVSRRLGRDQNHNRHIFRFEWRFLTRRLLQVYQSSCEKHKIPSTNLFCVISDGHYTSEPQTQGPQLVNEAFNHIQSATYWVNEDGTDNWIINNVRVSQTIDGLVR